MNSVEDKKRVLGLGQMSERADRKKEKRKKAKKRARHISRPLKRFLTSLLFQHSQPASQKKSKRKGKERKKDFKVVSCLGETWVCCAACVPTAADYCAAFHCSSQSQSTLSTVQRTKVSH